MALLILLVMLTAYLSGKMFIFPQQTNKANVRQNTSMQNLTAVTVCITDLSRNHNLFSLYTAGSNVIDIYLRNNRVTFTGQDYKNSLGDWSSLIQVIHLLYEYISVSTHPNSLQFIQEQDSHGRGFDINQSFVGMMSDVRMWNYVLSPCEIQRFVEDLNFTPGNVINWRALEFEATGRVLVENKLTCE
uniref:Pentraxin (PTX) domain-containing protein n=1 Tax=Neolamprologus brichardi TaxID=32507 RepID=A0A3Q4HEP7_NEOBR